MDVVVLARGPRGHDALRQTHDEIVEDDGSFYDEIPGFDGIYANTTTLEACRDKLLGVLEEWILFRVSHGLPLPKVDGKELTIHEIA